MNITKVNCKKCGRDIALNNITKHEKSCDGLSNTSIFKIDEKWADVNGLYRCPFCDKLFSRMGISTHIWRMHTDKGRQFKPFLNRRRGIDSPDIWNKGKTKNDDVRVRQMGETLSRKLKSGEITRSFLGKHHTKEAKEKISGKLSRNNNGGRCKWYSFIKQNGEVVKLQGTWEVRFAKILEIIDPEWIKLSVNNVNDSVMWVDDDGSSHTYTPDFYSIKFGKYYETKGYWWGNDKRKMELVLQQHPQLPLEIIEKKELTYLEEFYGLIV